MDPREKVEPWSVAALLLAAVLFLPASVTGQEASLPPGERPVPVEAGFFLVNLSGVAERDETFDADLYLSFRWRDSRLAFAGDEPRRYLEDAAVNRLREIWWPQLEFVNTAEPEITNRTLNVSPDGTVEYIVGLTSSFRADLDLRRFPFDSQKLEVWIESFLWTDDQMVFVPDTKRVGFNRESTFEGLVVTQVSADARRRELSGWGTTFSDFIAVIDVRRQAAFYLWTVFAPVTLIFLISCTVFVVPIDGFHDRVGISLAALLAVIATQFAMSFNLPQISYLTVIDRVFVVTYFCVAVGVLVSTLQATILDRGNSKRVDRWAGLGLPALFAVLLALCIVW
ncbi:MAG: hypothetical protein FJ144_07365 [Deltaproteobacteria bacterium]|nr:hypothetical protein [Deltaproteobacteria bacterium]